jgi:mannose/fructose/N-acetylgalactosamine-specific phosphotransferase system component IIC
MESGPTIWLLLITVGVAALGLIMAIGAMRNQKRTPQERVATEAATKQEYRAEERDGS